MKKCVCGETRYSKFSKGEKSFCRACYAKTQKRWRDKPGNREKQQEAQRKYRLTHPSPPQTLIARAERRKKR